MKQRLEVTTRPGVDGTTLVYIDKKLIITIDRTYKGYNIVTHPNGKFLGSYPSQNTALDVAYKLLSKLQH